MEVILGIAFLAFIFSMFFGLIMIFVEALKPGRKRKKSAYNFYDLRNREFRKASDSYKAIRDSKHSVKYLDKSSEELNIVYFIQNQKLDAAKIGVGQIGRLIQLINSTTSRNAEGIKVGWEILRIAYFDEMKDAYKAESKVLYHWRDELKLPEQLISQNMGFSQMKIVNKRIWVPTSGYTETVKLDSICKDFTWNLVLSSSGIIKEETKYLQNHFEHHNCEHLHMFSESKFKSKSSKKRSTKKSYKTTEKLLPEETFWNKIHKLEDDPKCWLWNSATSNGYAIGTYMEKLDLIHRVTWTMNYGQIPKKSFLRNECGIRNCVNPEHWRIEISQDYECINLGCARKSESVTKPGLCKTCRQREKRKRKKERSTKLD
jgi:hypothetical protein